MCRMNIDLRLDDSGSHVGDIRVSGFKHAGDIVVCMGRQYRLLDVCYEGNIGSAEVERVKKEASKAMD